MTMNKSIVLLSLLTLQGFVLLGEGFSLVISKRDSREQITFKCKDNRNENFFSIGSINRSGQILYSSKLYSFLGDPLDFSFDPINSVVINVGDKIDYALDERSNLHDLCSTFDHKDGQAYFLACKDSQGSRADYYVLNSANITSLYLYKAVKFAQYEKKTNIIFRQSLKVKASPECLASQYKKAVTTIGRNLDGIENIVVSLVLNEYDTRVNPSDFIEVFHKKFKEEDLDSGELPFELIRLDKDGNEYEGATQDESSSRWSSWFSYFKRPKVVFSFVTTAGVCLGTYWLVKKGWFSENN